MTVYAFHVSAAARRKYALAGELFGTGGNVIFLDVRTVRIFTQKLNEVRQAEGRAGLSSGDMNAMGLIDEILHYVTRLYVKAVDPAAISRALGYVERRVGRGETDQTLREFVREFPPRQVHAGAMSEQEYLDGSTGGTANREIILEELLHLWLANANPAFRPFRELFEDTRQAARPAYGRILGALGEYFRSRPPFGPDSQDLVAMLRSPAIAAPGSLPGQLEYIRTRWGHLLGDLLVRLLTGVDLLKEEARLGMGGFTPGHALALEYGGQHGEPEAFSPDKDWMPRVVMLAKNTLVWLEQLSRAHGRRISRLDQVPDQELDRISACGFSALWLIGVWERSRASRRIKQTMGNPEAEASAYSLFDYQVAAELGGEQALADLRDRAARRGIRLASDMVPNHTGIDSRWMTENPGRFLFYPRPHPPFPSYSFGGQNLSEDPRVGVYLEDHYYSRSDAAVVFKRVDQGTGEIRYIYHGNDGTHMPWNDTAQLDFLNPETREAVIRTILHVARLFPIIRFDAAMTLTKKHFQRLWFPPPGHGGDIPSRAECGMSRLDFDHAMPAEFWREVVDRAAAEAPDTLLLAEAFWLLEGFFVRTLGMHRVYNSAFMNMLKTEDNAGYRRTMKNTLEFDPEVLKRFVNFMSNPDEQTAIEQFGDGDKYFGVCALMATMPGLPMFAHGQLEGYREKYGMEFRRAYWEETPNQGLIERHAREIFPLLRVRRLFSGVDNFLLFDLHDPGGWVNEDCFAFSNGAGSEHALVLYNNRYARAGGWIRLSAAYAARTGEGMRLTRRSLAEGLGLAAGDDAFVIFREHMTGREYIRRCRELDESGMRVDLGAFQCQVFMDFRQVRDEQDRRWGRLEESLGGRGVPDMDAALRELLLAPVMEPFASLVNSGACRWFFSAEGGESVRAQADCAERHDRFLAAAQAMAPGSVDPAASRDRYSRILAALAAGRAPERTRPALWAWAAIRSACGAETDVPCPALSWLDDWLLTRAVRESASGMGWEEADAVRAAALVRVLLECRGLALGPELISRALKDPSAQTFLRVNSFEGVRWFHRESLGLLLEALEAAAAVEEECGMVRAQEKTAGTRAAGARKGAAARADGAAARSGAPKDAAAPQAPGTRGTRGTAAGGKRTGAAAGRRAVKACLAAAEAAGYRWEAFLASRE
jgi:glycosidase